MRSDEPSVRPEPSEMEWGSDAVAEALAGTGLPYISLTPGASYRGLHDSIVNHLGNRQPSMFVTLHEEHAVAVAHGYAKVTGRPLAVGLHSTVGLMHATMAIYNAWCDRVPMVILGATGPLDASERRPWIDWIHTALDQGALVRPYTKWDDQPGSAAAAVDAIIQATQIARTEPCGPTYVCLDAGMQEAPLTAAIEIPEIARHAPPLPPAPDREAVRDTLSRLASAERPLILIGRVGGDSESWRQRVELAERLGARVLTDLKTRAAFPTDHPLNPAAPGAFLTAAGSHLLRQADTILSLNWIDLAGTLKAAPVASDCTVISVGNEEALLRGWSKDHFGLAPSDLRIAASPDRFVAALLEELAAARPGTSPTDANWGEPAAADDPEPTIDGALDLHDYADVLYGALAGRSYSLVRLPLGWSGADLRATEPLHYLGQDGGGGVGSGPGMAVGAALALAGSGRLPVAVLGDGDYLMGSSALWSAAHYRLPLLVLTANNRSFFNDEVHQQRVAVTRGRPVENRWVGQHIRDPDPDLAANAESYGVRGFGPVTTAEELADVLPQALDAAATGPVLVDVHVATAGYPGAGSETPGAIRQARA